MGICISYFRNPFHRRVCIENQVLENETRILKCHNSSRLKYLGVGNCIKDFIWTNRNSPRWNPPSRHFKSISISLPGFATSSGNLEFKANSVPSQDQLVYNKLLPILFTVFYMPYQIKFQSFSSGSAEIPTLRSKYSRSNNYGIPLDHINTLHSNRYPQDIN